MPTGEFSIRIDPTPSSGLQGVWKDGKRGTVERQLDEVMLTFRKLAVWRRLDREREQARQARHNEELRRRADLCAEVDAEKARIWQLEDDAVAWKRAAVIREFITARAASGEATNDDDLASWLNWARDQADRIDPLRPTPSSVLDTPEKDLSPLSIWQLLRD